MNKCQLHIWSNSVYDVPGFDLAIVCSVLQISIRPTHTLTYRNVVKSSPGHVLTHI